RDQGQLPRAAAGAGFGPGVEPGGRRTLRQGVARAPSSSTRLAGWHRPVTIRVLLIRHGHVDFSSQAFRETPRGRQWDPALDQSGRDQANRLAARLALMERPTLVATSPFRRCRQTVGPFEEVLGSPATGVDDLG